MAKKKKILLFGGTFNPIHNGHLTIAQDAVELLSFDEVIFIPSATPPHKKTSLSFSHRLKMVDLAIEGVKYFRYSDIEAKREGPSYTIDTVRHFKKEMKDSEIYWLIGMDVIKEFKTWHKFKELLAECKFVIAGRNFDKNDNPYPPLIKSLGGKNVMFFFNKASYVSLSNIIVDISSTDIRNRIQQNTGSIMFLVPEKVEKYIYDNKLYQNK